MPWSIVTQATTANLGSGFDLLALALDLALEVHARPDVVDRVERAGTLRDVPLAPDRDWTFVAARRWAAERGRSLPALHVRMDSRIPVARGLGSSAAAIVAGIELANAILGLPRDVPSMLRCAAELEGHADNAAACLVGGLAWVSPETGQVQLLDPSPIWRLVLCWPELEIHTQRAREILPQSVPRVLATRQAHRFARLVQALLTGDEDALRDGLRDELHVPFRASLLPGFEEVCAAATGAGALGATLSGSGSAMLAIVPRAGEPRAVARAMQRAFEARGIAATGHVATIGGPPRVTIHEA